uniref:Ovule protein n=1 Tax=Caenorhabditis tropicalis TaxID=1561998 RepID=A0A1I7U3A1_9PELO
MFQLGMRVYNWNVMVSSSLLQCPFNTVELLQTHSLFFECSFVPTDEFSIETPTIHNVFLLLSDGIRFKYTVRSDNSKPLENLS